LARPDVRFCGRPCEPRPRDDDEYDFVRENELPPDDREPYERVSDDPVREYDFAPDDLVPDVDLDPYDDVPDDFVREYDFVPDDLVSDEPVREYDFAPDDFEPYDFAPYDLASEEEPERFLSEDVRVEGEYDRLRLVLPRLFTVGIIVYVFKRNA